MKLSTALFLIFLIFFILCDFNVFAQRTKVLKRRRKIMPSIIESMKKENTSIKETQKYVTHINCVDTINNLSMPF